MKPNFQQELTGEELFDLLNCCYRLTLDGIPNISLSIERTAEKYDNKTPSKIKAAKLLIRDQTAKCALSGFLTGFGGFLTLPVSIPANLASLLYIQMRMIATVAYMAGLDPESEQTQTFVYACLAGVSLNTVCKQAGISFGVRLTQKALEKLPDIMYTRVKTRISQKTVGTAGRKTLSGIGKLLPFSGAALGAAFDAKETARLGKRAVKWFFNGVYDLSEEDVIHQEGETVYTDIDDIGESGETAE